MTLKNDLNIAAWINSHYISEINIYKQLSYFSTMCINKVKGIRKKFSKFLEIKKILFWSICMLMWFSGTSKEGSKGVFTIPKPLKP